MGEIGIGLLAASTRTIRGEFFAKITDEQLQQRVSHGELDRHWQRVPHGGLHVVLVVKVVGSRQQPLFFLHENGFTFKSVARVCVDVSSSYSCSSTAAALRPPEVVVVVAVVIDVDVNCSNGWKINITQCARRSLGDFKVSPFSFLREN